jgi:hypothetical protein
MSNFISKFQLINIRTEAKSKLVKKAICFYDNFKPVEIYL